MSNFSLFLAADDPMGHVANQPALKDSTGLWLWSGNQGNLVLSGLILVLVGLWAASKIRTGPASQGAEAYVTRSRFAHMIEVICVYLREEVVHPLLGDRTKSFMPFLWTAFFFILINNLLGLVPILDILHLSGQHDIWIGGTATQNIFVTGVLAVIAMLVFNGAAIYRLGPAGFVKHMMGDLPWYMFPIAFLLLAIEAAGQFLIKPGALAIRLFANMTGGHVLLATLLIFGDGALHAMRTHGLGGNVAIFLISALGAAAIMCLELFVAFLQAFVFMFLVTVFISLMDHHEHGHEHEHGHAPGHEHAHA